MDDIDSSCSWDFGELASKYAALQPHLRAVPNTNPQRFNLDWTNVESAAILTEAILFVEYGLSVHIPRDQLVPAIPLRLNYVKWIEDLLKIGGVDLSAPIRGIDVGCGPSCIYALLACARNPSWSFLCSDIDSRSIQLAGENLNQCGLALRVQLKIQPDPTAILKNVIEPSEQHPAKEPSPQYDFCMFNPPFFASVEDKRDRTDTVCTATASELAHSGGGELALFKTLVHESLTAFHNQVRWYTFMFGIKSHLREAVKHLHSVGVDQVWRTNFLQGKTHRWAVAWTFQKLDLAANRRASPPTKRRKLTQTPMASVAKVGPPTKLAKFVDINVPSWDYSLSSLFEIVQNSIKELAPSVLKVDAFSTQVEFISLSKSSAVPMVLLPAKALIAATSTARNSKPSYIVKLNFTPALIKREQATRTLPSDSETATLQALADLADSIRHSVNLKRAQCSQ